MGCMISFRIMHKPESWNNLARKSYWTYKRVFEMWANLTGEALDRVEATPIGGVVWIEVTARWKSKRQHDVDNVLLKPILDALVKRGILAGDSLEYIAEIKIRGLIDRAEESVQVDIHPYF